MKIEHLQYFVTLANSSSISKAADKLHFSQQQLNRIITTLEDDIGTKLIERTPNGIFLTQNGEDFMKYANEILSPYIAMRNHFAIQSSESRQTLYTESAVCKLYLAPCLAMLASDIVKSLQKAAPNIKLVIYDKSSKLNESWFEKNAICFWALEFSLEELALLDGTILKAVHLGDISSYIAYNKKQQQFDKSNFHENYCPTSTLLHAYEQSAHKDNLNLVSSNIYHILDSIVQNNAVCSIPDFVLPKVKSLYPDIDFVQGKAHPTPFYVIFPETYTLTAADEVVINFIKSYIQNLQLLAKQIIENKL